MILDKVIKEQESKKLVCHICGGEIIDNTFKSGSRLAGTRRCKKCNNVMYF